MDLIFGRKSQSGFFRIVAFLLNIPFSSFCLVKALIGLFFRYIWLSKKWFSLVTPPASFHGQVGVWSQITWAPTQDSVRYTTSRKLMIIRAISPGCWIYQQTKDCNQISWQGRPLLKNRKSKPVANWFSCWMLLSLRFLSGHHALFEAIPACFPSFWSSDCTRGANQHSVVTVTA